MGEFLSTPVKDKISNDGETKMVSLKFFLFINYNSFDLVHAQCKDGVNEWKMLI